MAPSQSDSYEPAEVYLAISGDRVKIKPGFGPFTKPDAGIVKSLEIGSSSKDFVWGIVPRTA